MHNNYQLLKMDSTPYSKLVSYKNMLLPFYLLKLLSESLLMDTFT